MRGDDNTKHGRLDAGHERRLAYFLFMSICVHAGMYAGMYAGF